MDEETIIGGLLHDVVEDTEYTREELLKKYSGKEVYTDYSRMLAEVKPDLAVVSPVFGLTASVILECAKRKIDVFSEKPVATTLEDLEKVEKAVLEISIMQQQQCRFLNMHNQDNLHKN